MATLNVARPAGIGETGDATRSGNDIALPITAIRPAQIEASLQRIGQGTSTPDDADLCRAVWDALQSIAKALGIRADMLCSRDETILMIQYQFIAPEEAIKE